MRSRGAEHELGRSPRPASSQGRWRPLGRGGGAAILALALSLGAREAWAESSVAVVDMQQALLQTEEGRQAQGTLKRLFERKQQELETRQTELQRMREDLEKQSRVLSKEAMQRRTEDWQRRMVELQTSFVETNQELQKKQAELTAPLLKKLVAVCSRLAKQRGFELVVDRQAAPYARQDLDLTDQVVQQYNAGGADAVDSNPTPTPAPSASSPSK